jgi:hypothetical protein
MEDDLKKMEDNHKKKKKKIKDEPKLFGRRQQKKMEDDLKKNENEDDIKKNQSIPLKFRPNLSWDWLSSLRFFCYYCCYVFCPGWENLPTFCIGGAGYIWCGFHPYLITLLAAGCPFPRGSEDPIRRKCSNRPGNLRQKVVKCICLH